eukprot:contig_13787_g3317
MKAPLLIQGLTLVVFLCVFLLASHALGASHQSGLSFHARIDQLNAFSSEKDCIHGRVVVGEAGPPAIGWSRHPSPPPYPSQQATGSSCMLGHRRVHLRSSPASLFGGRLAHTQFLLGSSLTVVMTEYRCGSGTCQELVTLRPGEPIKCNKCGGRILYKLRTKNVVQYEAR